jgi:hypothetical protein
MNTKISPDQAGIPVGGTTGQVLAKNSNTDLDTEWVDVTGGGGGSLAKYTSNTATLSLTTLDDDVVTVWAKGYLTAGSGIGPSVVTLSYDGVAKDTISVGNSSGSNQGSGFSLMYTETSVAATKDITVSCVNTLYDVVIVAEIFRPSGGIGSNQSGIQFESEVLLLEQLVQSTNSTSLALALPLFGLVIK